MKNIGNDPRSLFNGNHFSSIYIYIYKNLNESTTVCSLRSLRSLALNYCPTVKWLLLVATKLSSFCSTSFLWCKLGQFSHNILMNW